MNLDQNLQNFAMRFLTRLLGQKGKVEQHSTSRSRSDRVQEQLEIFHLHNTEDSQNKGSRYESAIAPKATYMVQGDRGT